MKYISKPLSVCRHHYSQSRLKRTLLTINLFPLRRLHNKYINAIAYLYYYHEKSAINLYMVRWIYCKRLQNILIQKLKSCTLSLKLSHFNVLWFIFILCVAFCKVIRVRLLCIILLVPLKTWTPLDGVLVLSQYSRVHTLYAQKLLIF